MSKIGKRPIPLPAGATLTTEGQTARVVGPKGTLSWNIPQGITVRIKDAQIEVARAKPSDDLKPLHGLTRAQLANMVKGVTEGFSKQLRIVGVGFRAEVTADGLRLALGFSHPVEFPAPPGIAFTVDKNVITITGIDRQLVGETAARIRALRPPEPYKGKGILYADEQIRRKPGKAAKTIGPVTGGVG